MSATLIEEKDMALAIATAVVNYEEKSKRGWKMPFHDNSSIISTYVSAAVYGSGVKMLVNGGYIAEIEYTGMDAVERALKLHRRNIRYYVDIVLKGNSNSNNFIAPAVGYCQLKHIIYFYNVMRDIDEVSA